MEISQKTQNLKLLKHLFDFFVVYAKRIKNQRFKKNRNL